MIHFKKIEEYFAGTEHYISVLNPIRTDEYAWCDGYSFLKNINVKIDDAYYLVKGVEIFCYYGKRRASETITLSVDKIGKKEIQ